MLADRLPGTCQAAVWTLLATSNMLIVLVGWRAVTQTQALLVSTAVALVQQEWMLG
jgi:hypothetical protein